jgi:hypothetical protein
MGRVAYGKLPPMDPVAEACGNLESVLSLWWTQQLDSDCQLWSLSVGQFKAIWSAINDLLEQVATCPSDGFWLKFTDLNRKLVDCLSNSLALEELRANLFILSLLPPEIQATFINRIYGGESANISKKERENFDSLQFLTGGRLVTARLLTLLAECLDPLNPEGQLEQIQNSLKAQDAHAWPDEQWVSWFESWNKLDTWEIILSKNDEIREKTYTTLPPAMLLGRSDGNVISSCTEITRLPLFHESMRQQLAQLYLHPEFVRSLICPFKGQRRSCCGFGCSLKNIWDAIPNEEKRRSRPPSKVCLNCKVNNPH